MPVEDERVEEAFKEIGDDLTLLFHKGKVEEVLPYVMGKYAPLLLLRDGLENDLLKIQYHIPHSSKGGKQAVAEAIQAVRGLKTVRTFEEYTKIRLEEIEEGAGT